MVPEELVTAAYQLILGRDPEDRAVVRSAALGCRNVEELRKSFFDCAEFRAQVLPRIAEPLQNRFPLDGERSQQVEVTCDRKRLSQLLDHVEKTWKKLGEQKPYWSVLTFPDFENDQFEANRRKFYETGRADMGRFQVWASRNGVSLNPAGSCLEYGCGVGRVTRWLATVFGEVIACDVSAPHLELAREELQKQSQFANVRFLEINSLAALDCLPPVDVVFSVIVLQHNPPPVIALILTRLLSCMRPGGIGYFQVPTRARGYRFSVDDYLKEHNGKLEMEMHTIPQKDTFAIIRQAGCELLEVQPDNMTGSLDFISNTFLVRKPALP
jgi:SAM-dependent methyltransferase